MRPGGEEPHHGPDVCKWPLGLKSDLAFLLVHSNNYRCDGSFQGMFLSVSVSFCSRLEYSHFS